MIDASHEPPRWASRVWALVIVATAGCSESPGPVAPDAAPLKVDAVKSEVSYSVNIRPIVLEKCVSCHQPGDAAPFSLLTYDDAKKRARQIADVTASGLMPPWLPRNEHGLFAGDRRLTDAQKQLLKAWADADAPAGPVVADAPATGAAAEWKLGKPDLILESPAYEVPAAGADEFRNFVIATGIDRPRWVESIELRPLNPRVTHHARIGLDDSRESERRDADDPLPGYAGMAWRRDPEGQLVTWVPGIQPGMVNRDFAWRLLPERKLVLHTHLQPSGKPETAQFRLGIRFTDEPPRLRPLVLRIGSRDIDIPAGERRHVLADEFTLPIDVTVHAVFPHAHSLCESINVAAELPDGKSVSLIEIEHFDEKWHDNYRYANPIELPRGTKLRSAFTYDNSAANPRNRHHPPVRVRYGSNADEEMADVYLQVVATEADEREMLVEDFKQYELKSKVIGFQRTLEGHPEDPFSREGLAASYVALGEPDKALAALTSYEAGAAESVYYLTHLGLVYATKGDHAKAEEVLRQALMKDRAFPLAWLGLGQALLSEAKLDEAEQAFRQATDLAPELTDAQLGLAGILMRGGKFDEAAAACEAALRNAPDHAPAHLKLAEIRVKQGRADDALELLRAAYFKAPYIHPPKVLLAVYSLQNGDPERARTLLQEACQEAPEHPVPELFLGQLAMNGDQLDVAREHLGRAAILPTPTNWPRSHRHRFLVLLHAERFHLAERLKDIGLAREAVAAWLLEEPGNGKLLELRRELGE